MNVVYVDSSALLKRVLREAESGAVRILLRDRHEAGDEFAASSLAWVEVWRALRRLNPEDVGALVFAALSGVAEFPLDDIVLRRARRIGSSELRTLDAIHLASAMAVGADSIITYDERLASGARALGLAVLAPVV